MTSATTSTSSVTHEPHDHPALTPALRWMSNVLRLCHLCARPACRRAQACRGEPRECLARYAPLVPEEARDGAQAMMESKDIGLSFDELRDEAPEVDDLIEWQELVQTSAARGKEMRVAAGKAQ